MTLPLSNLKEAILAAVLPTATFLIGAQGTGKSTWVRANSGDLPNVTVISSDRIIETMAAEAKQTYSYIWHSVSLRNVDKQMYYYLDRVVAIGGSVIIDRTNMSDKSRAKVLAHIPANYVRFAAVFTLDRDELSRRLLDRESTGKIIAPDVVDATLQRYQEPSKNEFDEIFTS